MEPGFCKIIHPETGNVAEVPISSLSVHYRSGWVPLDESPDPAPELAPAPVRASAVAAAADAVSTISEEGE